MRREFTAVTIAIVVGVIGFAANYLWPCSNAFARSGSLIVCVAIWFGLKDLKLAYRQAFEKYSSEQESNRLENDIVFGDEELEKKVRGTTDQRLETAEIEVAESGERAAFIDTWIFIAGTAIWGFGDLLVSRFASWSC